MKISLIFLVSNSTGIVVRLSKQWAKFGNLWVENLVATGGENYRSCLEHYGGMSFSSARRRRQRHAGRERTYAGVAGSNTRN